MLVNTRSKPVPFKPRSRTEARGWAGARDVGDDAAAAVIIGVASWAPANAMAAHATRRMPDGRICMCRPPRPAFRAGLPHLPGGQVNPRRGHYHSGLQLRNRSLPRTQYRSADSKPPAARIGQHAFAALPVPAALLGGDGRLLSVN